MRRRIWEEGRERGLLEGPSLLHDKLSNEAQPSQRWPGCSVKLGSATQGEERADETTRTKR